ncbi:hypothetical protein [Granulicella rosea]|uniref:hypothetical protein n=1 Tax=Granulicella rosea TaxID=474952 RepID=UPI000B770339|nr:hypothetical protein [Granulicella rosea]
MILIAAVIFLEFWVYSLQLHQNPRFFLDILQGIADAPAQYRIGVVFAADWLARHTHQAIHHTLVLIDFCSALAMTGALTTLLFRSPVYRRAERVAQWFGGAVFCLLTLNYLLWLTWYVRPETLTSAALLSLTLLLLSIPMPGGAVLSRSLGIAGMIGLSAVAGIVRADLQATLHAGVCLICLLGPGRGFALPRWLQFGASALSLLVACACQYYMMHVRYPHATYGSSPVLMLFSNLRGPLPWVVPALALFPWFWTTFTVLRGRFRPEGPALSALAGSLLFFCMWMTVGRFDEVRIFLPYALTLMPLTVTVAMTRLIQPDLDSRVE